LFSTYLGANIAPSLGPPTIRPDVLGAVDDLQVTARVQEAGVAGVVPAVARQHLGRGRRVLVVLLQQARAADQDLAVVGQADLHAVDGHAHGVGLGLVVGLQADEHRGLGDPYNCFRLMPIER
jgi:hypothetical protein